MNKATVTGSHKLTLILVGLGLCAMLAASFFYRTTHPSLSRPGRQEAAQQAPVQDGDELANLMAMMRENPDDPDVLKHIADHFIRAEDWNRASFFVEKALVITPSDPQALYMYGIVLFNQKKHAEAAATFENLLVQQDDPSARYNLGILYKHFLKQPEKAAEHLNALLQNGQADEEMKARARNELETQHK